MLNFYVYLAVIVSGAAVLAIELLGTRIIAPFYGASIYLWSALISVTLAALSVGYAIGGRLADRGAKLGQFCTIIGVAGAWIVVIPWVSAPLLNSTESLGLRAAVLISAIVLFFPPLALLGMVSPFAIRMKASSLEVVGRTAGNLYAVSTVASVVAAIATGFFLIPNVGVHRLVFLIGIALIATAAVGLAVRREIKGTVLGLLIVAIGGTLAGTMSPVQAADPASGVIAVRQSAYSEIRVVNFDDVRYMLNDGSTHSAADTVHWVSHLQYANVLDMALRFFHQPGNMLLIGLGGGSVAKDFARDGWSVDAVEIDPVVTQLAHQYFNLREDEARVYAMDGRQYLATTDKKYDVIVLDAFGSSFIPFHLVTQEAFGLIKSHLAPQGMLAMNVTAVGWKDKIVNSLTATLHRQFAHVTTLPIVEPPGVVGNLVLMASDREIQLDRELPIPLDRFSADYDRAHAWDNRFESDTTGALVLTDDLNPIDVWSERVNFAARQQLHEFLDKRGVAW